MSRKTLLEFLFILERIRIIYIVDYPKSRYRPRFHLFITVQLHYLRLTRLFLDYELSKTQVFNF